MNFSDRSPSSPFIILFFLWLKKKKATFIITLLSFLMHTLYILHLCFHSLYWWFSGSKKTYIHYYITKLSHMYFFRSLTFVSIHYIVFLWLLKKSYIHYHITKLSPSIHCIGNSLTRRKHTFNIALLSFLTCIF